jgi:hypothetical protein
VNNFRDPVNAGQLQDAKYIFLYVNGNVSQAATERCSRIRSEFSRSLMDNKKRYLETVVSARLELRSGGIVLG